MTAIREAIRQYASPPDMEEQIDSLAIYQIGETEAFQLLPPTNFYNSIRNFFDTPLALQSGPTALVDSLVTLLDNIDSLKPQSDMATSLVVLTDGTDVISTKFNQEDVGRRAVELGVPIHTIWLENENMLPANRETGRDYLAQVATQSRGLAAQLSESAEVQAIWDRISAFRVHSVIQYQPEALSGGEYEVVLSLRSDPAVQATTRILMPAAAPSVTLEIPPEQRELTLPNLDDPIKLALDASVSWLDGVERELTVAQLLVNGLVDHEIDVRDIDHFEVEIENFNYGPNTVQLVIGDELGQQAKSPAITLTVLLGETSVPEAIRSDGLLGSSIVRLVLNCFIVLIALVLLFLLAALARRWQIGRRLGLDRLNIPFLPPRPGQAGKGGWNRARRRARRIGRQGMAGQGMADKAVADQRTTDQAGPIVSREIEAGPEPTVVPAPMGKAIAAGAPYLETLESVTRMPPVLDLTAIEHRVGRSPKQSDIAFENDITVSRMHALIVLEGSDYRIYDGGSSSGTWVNNRPVPEYGFQLADGDLIRLGDVLVRYRRL
jgi:hypothetical protein